ncbi:MAG: site-specific integrase, partial [Proteobacteria bacterium]|nr:site-specific integrase [Pseudomonadota bacterium]
MPGTRPYEIRDTQLKGLLLRVQPSGVKSFYVEYGRGKRLNLGRADAVKPTQARQEARNVLAEAYKGKDPIAASRRAKARSFGEFVVELYKPWAEEHIRTSDETIRRLERSFPEFQKLKLEDISPYLVEKWRTARRKAGAKPGTVNRDLDDLKSCLAKAVAWGLLTEHPIVNVRRLRADPSPAVRFLPEDEETRLRGALDAREARIRAERASANAWRRARGYPELPSLGDKAPVDHLKPLVLLSLNTGLRRGELFGLRWDDVDLDRANVTVRGPQAKSGRTRHVPLNREALSILRICQPVGISGASLVFPGRHGERFDNVRRSWAGVLETAGIEKFRWHDLRHSFA